GLQWLGHAFEAKDFHAEIFNSELNAKEIYNQFMAHLHSFKSAELQAIKDTALKTIFIRTIQFRKLKKQVKNKFFANRPFLNSPCKKCKNEPDNKKCIQKVMISPTKMDESLIGCGVSFAPREKITAVPMKNSQSGQFEPRCVLHPEKDLGLKAIRCSPEILDRCGSMTYYFCDKKAPNEVLDFWTYGAFPDHVLQNLILHHRRLQNVKAIKRGKQFDSYSQGEMFAKGSRAPKGGLPGDSYAMYVGMEAIDEESINALFDDAEVWFFFHIFVVLT
ncbi:hypothetical protein CVT26_009913, partial [Gymnopilus dilepis]